MYVTILLSEDRRESEKTMKKIINGKLYNTETAVKMATRDNGLYPSNFHYTKETLFLKKTGEFFLYGEGGPASKWAYFYEDGGRTSGEGIELLSRDEAMAWTEMHCDADRYIEIFGEPEE